MSCCEKFTHAGFVWLRVLVGLAIASHGYTKIVGGNMEGFVTAVAGMGMPLPFLLAWAAALSELVGGVLLALGFGTRIAAAFIFVTMSVAFFKVHGGDPFKVKELAFVYWAVSGFFIAVGGGRWALDRLVWPCNDSDGCCGDGDGDGCCGEGDSEGCCSASDGGKHGHHAD